MSDQSHTNRVAVVGWLLAGIFAAVVFGEFLATRSVFEHYKDTEYRARHHSRYCGAKIAIVDTQKPAKGDPRDRNNPEQRKYELCQQWRSANASEEAARVAWLQFGVAAMGLAGVIIATYFAAGAYRAARRQADAAERAVEVTRDMGRRQMRAYVSAKDIHVVNFVAGRSPTFVFNPVNTGQTPAYHCEILAAAGPCVDASAQRVIFNPRPALLSRVSIGPNQPASIDVTCDIVLTDEIIAAVHDRETAYTFFFCGIIRYTDAFGVRRRTIFRTFIRPGVTSNKGEMTLSATRRNNRST